MIVGGRPRLPDRATPARRRSPAVTGAAGSAPPRPDPRRTCDLHRRPADVRLTAASRWLLAVLVVGGLYVWALVALTAWTSIGAPLASLVCSFGLIWWRTSRTPEMRRAREVTARALADHSDSGPQHRAVVEAVARDRAVDQRVLSWVLAVLLLVAVAAGVAVAVARDRIGAAPPLAGLALVALWLPTWSRRRQLAAARWLDDPPYEQEHA